MLLHVYGIATYRTCQNTFYSLTSFLQGVLLAMLFLARCDVILLSLNLYAELPSGNICLDFGISHDSLNKRDMVALERSPKFLALEVHLL